MMLPWFDEAGIGFVVGAIGTIVGSGGGFLLLPVLMLIMPDAAPASITAISLAVVSVNAVTSTIVHWHQRRIDLRSAAIFAAVAIPGALLGALATSAVPRRAFDIGFGAILVLVALWLLVSKRANATTLQGSTHRELIDAYDVRYAWSFDMRTGIVASSGIGFLSSILGIGGGVLQVPMFVSLLGFPEHVATATSVAILSVSAVAGTVTHLARGDLSGDMSGVVAIICGTIAGAIAGAGLSPRIPARVVMGLLSAALITVGVRMIVVP